MNTSQKPTDPTSGNARFDTFNAETYLGLAHGTLAVGRSRGSIPIPYYKMGKKVVYHQKDLDEHLASCRVEPREVA